MSVGKSIKFLRIARGLKQSELAKELGVSSNYISLIENDKREPSLTFLNKLSKQIDVPLSLFFLDMDFNAKDYSPQEQVLLLRIKDLILQIESMRLERERLGNEST